jgi:hypothetical protein
MIVVNGENVRILAIMVLAVLWFYLINQELRK